MKNRINKAIETMKHRKAIFQIWKSNKAIRSQVSAFRVMVHDLEKLVLILVVGDAIATKFHRGFVGHHQMVNPTDSNLMEAILDWESARFTKPTKPMNARQTAVKWYPHLVSRVNTVCDKWGI